MFYSYLIFKFTNPRPVRGIIWIVFFRETINIFPWERAYPLVTFLGITWRSQKPILHLFFSMFFEQEKSISGPAMKWWSHVAILISLIK